MNPGDTTLPLFPRQPQPPRRRRVWPVWLTFGIMLLPGIVTLFVLGVAKDGAASSLDFQRDAVGRSVVLTGTLSEVDTTSGLPKTTSYYDVTVPDADGGPGETVTFTGGEQWGFPPSSDYPAEQSFLVVTDDPPRSVSHGPVGSIRPVTEKTVQDAETGFAIAQTVWVVGIVVFWILALGLPALAILLSERNRRARTTAAHPAQV